ncbi:hypothetical protein BKH41_06870 [Helicobacter sp. 12S02232-10]|nr:hypothetical protein BKH41_06870 [Helicobacter sp. 12S02232-10]
MQDKRNIIILMIKLYYFSSKNPEKIQISQFLKCICVIFFFTLKKYLEIMCRAEFLNTKLEMKKIMKLSLYAIFMELGL